MALTNSQYDSIIKQYQQTQAANRMALLDRKQEVYSRIPTFQELENTVSGLSVAYTRYLLSDQADLASQTRDKLADTKQEKINLLISNGYPADYLEPIYTCPHCQDTGYISLSTGEKNKCHCFLQQELSILYKQSNIQEMLATENFSTLSERFYEGEDLVRFRNAVDICKNFVKNFNQPYQNLFFYGTVGTGKSFLSGCVAAELIKQGKSVIYFSASALFDTLADYSFHGKSREGSNNPFEDIYHCDLLIIDDLGTEITNNFVTTQLFACLNERHLAKKSTIISTNINLEELRDRYSERIFSRIMSNYHLCKLSGPDIRIMKRRMANTDAD